MTIPIRRSALAGALLAALVTTPQAGIGEERSAPDLGIDCTFFQSQAFNQPEDHYTAQMAQMCALLSSYKRAVIETNRAKFMAGRAAEGGTKARPVPRERVAAIPRSSDSGKFLIARELGLIDALAALSTTTDANHDSLVD